jgi:DNA-binding LytR/AlgR family response regulator
MSTASPTALIAEDEPLLALALQAELQQAWPALRVLATVGDGASAVRQALALQPDVLFFDIRMPGLSGLEAAEELAEAWPTQGPNARPFPALVFVTAYDQYAVQAFEREAVDYLLKPVQAARLHKTVQKLQQRLAHVAPGANEAKIAATRANDFEATLTQLRGLLRLGLSGDVPAAPSVTPAVLALSAVAPEPLKVLQVSVGTSIHLVAVPEVVYFEAADKYVRVLTAEREYLVRTPLKELLPLLDATQFWQIHRATVVQASRIDKVLRDEAGKLQVVLRDRPEKLPVSRLYAHLFKAL